MKVAADSRLAVLAQAQLAARGVVAHELAVLERGAALFKDRCATVAELADWLTMLHAPVAPSAEDLATHVAEALRPALQSLATRLAHAPWDKAGIAAALKETLAAHQMKMPQLAPAVRVLVCGRAQTPSVDAVLALFERQTVLDRLQGI
jgi:glutamyl-tRNA synthetase